VPGASSWHLPGHAPRGEGPEASREQTGQGPGWRVRHRPDHGAGTPRRVRGRARPLRHTPEANLARFESQDGDQVQRVVWAFPLDPRHPGARQAHAAARDASAQGTCWASHDVLCVHTPPTSPEQRTASAQERGLVLLIVTQVAPYRISKD
jgi:hypothetical protein